MKLAVYEFKKSREQRQRLEWALNECGFTLTRRGAKRAHKALKKRTPRAVVFYSIIIPTLVAKHSQLDPFQMERFDFSQLLAELNKLARELFAGMLIDKATFDWVHQTLLFLATSPALQEWEYEAICGVVGCEDYLVFDSFVKLPLPVTIKQSFCDLDFVNITNRIKLVKSTPRLHEEKELEGADKIE